MRPIGGRELREEDIRIAVGTRQQTTTKVDAVREVSRDEDVVAGVSPDPVAEVAARIVKGLGPHERPSVRVLRHEDIGTTPDAADGATPEIRRELEEAR